MKEKNCLPNSSSRFREALTVCALTLFCLAPFLTKPFNIDEPLFVWCAKHIVGHPLDPYGFSVNWYGTEMQMSAVTKNPPLACYYLAIAGKLFGWHEFALHAAMLIPAIAAVLGTYFLAARLCSRPLEATLAALFTPAFLLSSTTVMCDTMFLAFFVWAVLIWIIGLDKNRHSYFAVSAFMIGICALTKYYGIVLIALLPIYSLMKKRALGWWAACFLITVVMLVAYQLITRNLYGQGLLLDAGSYASAFRQHHGYTYLPKILIGLSFTGGCVASVLFFANRLWCRKWLLGGVAVAAILTLILPSAGVMAQNTLSHDAGIRWVVAAQFGLMIVLGMSVLALAVTDFFKHRNAESALLGLWVLGTFIFAALVNWTANGRSILPMVPAVGILVMRRIDGLQTGVPGNRRRQVAVPLMGASALALIVTLSDFQLANVTKKATAEIKNRYDCGTKTIWYQGHWGFQYYMNELGYHAIDFKNYDLHNGDVLVLPENNTNVQPLPEGAGVVREVLTLAGNRHLTTMSQAAGAGFYTDSYGPLPYAFGAVPSEKYFVVDMTTRMRSGTKDPSTYSNTGSKLAAQGRFEEAVRCYESALKIDPEDPSALNNFGWLLATCPEKSFRNGSRAISLAERANGFTGGENPEVLDTLAAAYAEAGRYPEAISTARRALDLSTGQDSVAKSVRMRLRLYEAGLPYHEPEVGP